VPEAEMQNLVHQQIPLTPSLGLRLAKYFGTSADFWINLQLRWDLYHTLQAEAEALEKIQPRSA
jgi:addiction module HigA family antidote